MAEHTQTLRVSACRLGPCLPMTFTIDWLKPYHTGRGGGRQQHTKNQEQLTSHVSSVAFILLLSFLYV